MAVTARDSDLLDYKLLSSGAACYDNNNRFCSPAFDKVIAVALTLWLWPGKTSKRVRNVLPETFPADTCFPNVPQFFQKRNSVSGSKKCFCREARTCFAARNNVPRAAKLGNRWENVCPQQMFLPTCFRLVLPGFKYRSLIVSPFCWCFLSLRLALSACFITSSACSIGKWSTLTYTGFDYATLLAMLQIFLYISDWICKNIPPENVPILTRTILAAFLTRSKKPKINPKEKRKGEGGERREKKRLVEIVKIGQISAGIFFLNPVRCTPSQMMTK